METEKRLIDANKLNVCYLNVGTVMFPKMEAYVRADDIANADTVDAVEVVRCKDCRFYEKETVSCSFVTTDTNWYEDDFCSYGERKDND